MEFDYFAKKYRYFTAPSFNIMIEGTDITREDMVITSVKVDTSLDKADSFSFSVSNAFDPVKKEFKWLDNYLTIGKNIQIDLGYADVLETVFWGYITSVRYELTPSEQTDIVVSGLDYSFKLMKGIKSRVFSKVKDSDAAKQVISAAGLKAIVDNTSVEHDLIQQVGITDYRFLLWLAGRNGYEFFVSGKEVYFRKPHQDKTPIITLTWGQNILSLYKEDDLTDQLGEVKVRSWDPKTKKALVGKAESISKIDSGQDGKTILEKMLGNVEENYASEAKTQQQATLRLMQFKTKVL